MSVRRFLVLAATLLSCSRRAAPPADRSDGALPVLRVPRVAPGSIHIDGRLDEAAWENAAQTGAFVDVGSGHPSAASRVPATARVAWDDAALYVAVVGGDRAAATPFRRDEVDPHLWERASAIELMLQPGEPGDNRDYYEIQVDVGGAVWDTAFDDYNVPVWRDPSGATRFGHQEWDAHLQRATSVDSAQGSYAVELALPWASLHAGRVAVPPHVGDTWRMNLYSFRDGQSDALAWSPILRRGNFHFAARWGRITFVDR